MQSLGQNILIKYLLPRNQRFEDMVSWLEIEETRFRRICCELFRNLGFITEFKTVFANHREFILRIFELILFDEEEFGIRELLQNHNQNEVRMALRSLLDTKLSLITLIWSIIHKNSNHCAFLNRIGCPSLLPLLQTLESLSQSIRRNKELSSDRHLQIIFNSLRDRVKLVHALLSGM